MKQEIDSIKIGNAIKYLRKREGYTQKELAERLSVSDKAVSKWERGIGVPDVSFLKLLSIILDVDIDCILDGNVAYSEKSWKGILLLNEYAFSVVYDKLLVEYLLSYFLLVNIRDIFILCSESQICKIQEQYGDGTDCGVHITCCEVSSGSVLSEDIRKYQELFSTSKILLINGTDIVFGCGLTKFMQRALLSDHELTTLVLAKGDSKGNIGIDEEKRIFKGTKPEAIKRSYEYCPVPFLFVAGGVHGLLKYRFLSYEDLLKLLIDTNVLYAEMMDRGFVSFSIRDKDTLMEASLFISLMQKETGLAVGNMREIAMRRGMIPAGGN